MRIALQRAWWFPVFQGWVIGLVFISVYLAAYHQPRLRGAPVAILATPAARALERDAARTAPGALRFVPVRSRRAAVRAIQHADVLAAVLPGRPTEALYAGANGPSARAAVTAALGVPAGGPGLDDVDPLRAQDSAGLSLFYLTFGTVLAAYLFAIAAVTLGVQLAPVAHWANAALAATLLGISIGVLAGPVFGVVANADAPAVAGICALLALAVSGTTAMLLTVSRSFGTLIGTILLLTLGTASASSLPPALLPAWAQLAREILANGLALDAIRGLVYFHDHDVVRGLIGLGLWALVPVLVIEATTRRQTAATPVTHAHPDPDPEDS